MFPWARAKIFAREKEIKITEWLSKKKVYNFLKIEILLFRPSIPEKLGVVYLESSAACCLFIGHKGGGVDVFFVDRKSAIFSDATTINDDIVELLKGLPGLGETAVANDDFEVGQKMLSFRPHIVLLDLMMPGLNGFGVCHKIKDNPATQDIRVIVMTGHNTPENIQKALEAGAEACLPKPIDKVQLFEAIMLDQPGTIGARV